MPETAYASRTQKTAFTRRQWAIAFAFWTVPLIIVLLYGFYHARVTGRPYELRTIAPLAASCYLWAVLSPVVLLMGQRIGLSRPNRATAIAAHVAAMLLVTVLQAFVNTGVRWLALPHPDEGFFIPAVKASFTGHAAAIYVAILLITYAKRVTQQYRERDLEAAQLRAQLAEARLSALRMQLNPHFLFNSLNAIAGLVREHDNRTAVRVLALLSDVLRQALSTSDVHEVPLRQELTFIEEYLEIERVRFPDRLEVQCRVDPDALDALVPSLILQPIVENALRHGIHQRSARGRLEFEAVHRDDVLRLIVTDDGPGVTDEAPARGGGVGLSNTRARLRQLYGNRGRLSLLNARPAGAMVVIELPYHLAVPSLTLPPAGTEARHV